MVRKIFFIFYIITLIFSSCVSAPEEGKYENNTYGEIIQRNGEPKYDNIYIVDNNVLGYEIDPYYGLYFTEEELENGVQIRKLIWERIFNRRLIIWLKNIDGQWIAFDSVEYNSKYVKF